MPESSVYSVKALANWVLDYAGRSGEQPTNMALNKLVYFAYEFALKSTGRKLTNAKIEAWDHGPVFREVYSAFKKFGADPITERATWYNTGTNEVETVVPAIDPDDELLMIKALGPLIRLPAYILRELSHDASGPWAAIWHHDTSSNPGMEITDDIILNCPGTARIVQ